jgi:hypothetical protein
MSTLGFLAVYLAGTGCAFIFSMLMLVVPVRAIGITNRIAGSERAAEPNPRWRPGLLLGWRIGGLVGAFISGAMMEPAIEALFSSSKIRWVLAGSRPGTGTGSLSLLGEIALLGAGVYIAGRPQQFVRWIERRKPELRFSREAVSRSLPLARIMGALIALVGALGIIMSLSRLR